MYENKTNRNLKESAGVEAMNILKRIITALVFAAAFAVTPVLAEEISYEYDEQGRLIAAYYENGKMITYAYDAAGNRTISKVIIDGNEVNVTYDTDVDLVVLPLLGGYPLVYNVTNNPTETTVDFDDYEATISNKLSGGSCPAVETPINLRTMANGDGYTGGHARITFNIECDVYGTKGTSVSKNGAPAIQTGDWPDLANIQLTLNISAGVKVYGGGGAGGAGGGPSSAGGDGGNGAVAISMGEGLVISNSGTIKGGGGGGGGGGGYENPDWVYPDIEQAGGGGGGGGFPNGQGGSGASPGGGNGVNGSTSGGGAGGGTSETEAGIGREGGGSGVDGSNGQDGDSPPNSGTFEVGGYGGDGAAAFATFNHALVCTNSGSGTGCP